MFTCGWGGNQFTPLLTMYRQANGYSATIVDALLGAYVLGLAPALLGGGTLSDRYGRRAGVLLAIGASGLGSVSLAMDRLAYLFTGRLLCGVALGLGMTVGTSWVTELTVEGGQDKAVGARRASLSLTAGFGAGAGVAGMLAQWSPWPGSVPYFVHVALAALVLVAVLHWSTRARPNLNVSERAAGRGVASLRQRRFRRLVLPMAPWVFGAAGVAYAILPQAMAGRMGHWALLYATALTVATLSAGVLVQPVARRLDHAHRPRGLVASMVAISVGIGLAAFSVALGSPWWALAAAVVLGLAFGVALVSGLVEVQRLSRPEDLVAMTGIYYTLTYVGFLMPTGLAVAERWAHTDLELCLLAVIALCCTLFIATGRSLPPVRTSRTMRSGAGMRQVPDG